MKKVHPEVQIREKYCPILFCRNRMLICKYLSEFRCRALVAFAFFASLRFVCFFKFVGFVLFYCVRDSVLDLKSTNDLILHSNDMYSDFNRFLFFFFKLPFQRKRERDRERQTDRQTDRERERDRERETESAWS